LRETTDEPLYEIINGERVELPPMSMYASLVASRVVRRLGGFVDVNALGEVVSEVLFSLPHATGRNRRPDVAFVSYERWAKDRPLPVAGNAWEVVPDLTVEVVSPHDLADEIMQKITEYFRAGVRLVWVIYPQQRLVQVYESVENIKVLKSTEELDGGTVVQGFRLPLSTLFPISE
jgi:Uma2 family endonuclease